VTDSLSKLNSAQPPIEVFLPDGNKYGVYSSLCGGAVCVAGSGRHLPHLAVPGIVSLSTASRSGEAYGDVKVGNEGREERRGFVMGEKR